MSLEGKTPEEIAALATLSDSVMSNPETRLAYQRLLKKANPNISVPELELESRVAAAVGATNTTVAELRAENEKNTRQAAANALYEALRDDRVVISRNDFAEVVKYAAAKGFQTTDAGLRMAAQHRRAEQEAAEPSPSLLSQRGVEMPVDKDLMKDPVGWSRKTAAAAMDELIKGRKAA